MLREALGQAAKAIFTLEREVRSFSGARAVRISEWRPRSTGEHAHDWPILSIYVMGDYRKVSASGVSRIASPSVVLHPAGEHHANEVGGRGLEQIDIEFDPAWVGRTMSLSGGLTCWVGGPVSAAARNLARRWTRPEATEAELAQATAAFFALARRTAEVRLPPWLSEVQERLSLEEPPSTRELARDCGMSPAWLTHAYRSATGEGLAEALRRRRVERAATLLRGSGWGIAAIAAECGFCDQSHMTHTFRQMLGRTPMQVRAESAPSPISAVA
jgi:AraC-like DNA-binding protein